MLYVPTPDPSSADLAADARAVLTMSEAGLPAPGSGSCGETEDPICARRPDPDLWAPEAVCGGTDV